MITIGLALALIIGLTLGLFGGGGSTLTVPIFVYVLGFDAKLAIAMSFPVVGATSLVGGRPGGITRVLAAWYRGPGLAGPDAAVGLRAGVLVETLPPLGCALRSLALLARFDCPDRSIVFSGDTSPSENLVELARGADILVHEVIDLQAITGLLRQEAQARRLRKHLLAAHTPMIEGWQRAARAGVKTLVLNHFVPGTPPIPHVGGPIVGPGAPTVLIGSMPAAVVGDSCVCVGPPASIVKGSATVMIGGKPAARMGDTTAHGGSIAIGLPTVMIGG